MLPEDKEKRMEDNALAKRRMRIIYIFFALLLFIFLVVLYNLQIAHGEEYLENSSQKIVQTETVSAARGEILDSQGNKLVTNQVSYEMTLDLSLLGTGEERSTTLQQLLDLCQEYDVSWNDSLAITKSAPFTYTSTSPFYSSSEDEDGTVTYSLTRLGKLALNMGWITDDPTENPDVVLPTAEELLESMCSSFNLDGGVTKDNRAICGVLYELYLRDKGLYWVDYIFASDVDTDFIAVVKEMGFSAAEFQATTSRQYNTTYAAHLLGRVSAIDSSSLDKYLAKGYSMDEMVGSSGVEAAFEDYLRGISGTRIVETNTNGKITGESWAVDSETGESLAPQPGGNVELTLDIGLQEVVEKALADEIGELEGAEGGAAVVIDVNSGEILAMASYPTYDLSTFSTTWSELQDDPLKPLYNRALQGTYAPGSTFKMVTATAGLQEGIITPTTKLHDTGAYTYYTSNIAAAPKCWIYSQYGTTHGWLNVSKAIEVSCNVFFYDVGRQVGITKLNEYARLFGLGEPTGIELSESTGIVAGPDYTEGVLGEIWYEGSTLSAAIGQENNQFTPLQLANYVATLVNGGNRYSAHLLKRVLSYDYSEVLYEQEPVVLNTVEISEENLDAIKEGMRAVAESSADLQKLQVTVGAKTGTAQVAATSTTNAVFVAFAPYDDPQIAVSVVVEKGGSGSQLAAVVAKIFAYYFGEEDPYAEISEDTTAADTADSTTTVSTAAGAVSEPAAEAPVSEDTESTDTSSEANSEPAATEEETSEEPVAAEETQDSAEAEDSTPATETPASNETGEENSDVSPET